METRRLIRSGGSLAVSLPRAFTRLMGLHVRDHVVVEMVNDEELRIRKLVLAAPKNGKEVKYGTPKEERIIREY